MGEIIMSIKVIIDQNNDILYNRLSNLHYEDKLELLKITKEELPTLIGKINSKEHLIILDSINSVLFCTNILKNLFKQIDKVDIIILVIDFKSLTNIIDQKKHHLFFKKKQSLLYCKFVSSYITYPVVSGLWTSLSVTISNW